MSSDLEDMERAECTGKRQTDEEGLMEPLFVPIKSEPDFKGKSEENVMEENRESTEDLEDMDSNKYAVKRRTYDAEALLTPTFVPIKSESELKGMSGETTMKGRFLANETTEGSSKELNQPSHVEISGASCSLQIAASSSQYTSEHGTVLQQDLQWPDLYAVASCSTGGDTMGYEGACGRHFLEGCEEEQETGGRQSEGETSPYDEVNHLGRETEGSASSRSSSEGNKRKERRKGFECSICQKTFPWQSKLLTHMQIHTGERPFRCDQCEKSFRDSNDLSRHKRIHTGERPYKCTQCEKSFHESGDLMRHMRIHTSKKIYKCSQCEKAFHQSCNLTRHIRIHMGEKSHKCSQCEKSFCQSDSLKKHMRIHTGEKPYKCNQCAKAFHNCSNLIRHMQIHSIDKPYKCSQCEKSFKDSSNLKQHMRVHRK